MLKPHHLESIEWKFQREVCHHTFQNGVDVFAASEIAVNKIGANNTTVENPAPYVGCPFDLVRVLT